MSLALAPPILARIAGFTSAAFPNHPGTCLYMTNYTSYSPSVLCVSSARVRAPQSRGLARSAACAGATGLRPHSKLGPLQGVRVGALAFLSHKLKLLAPSPGQELLAEAPGGYK